MKETGKKRILIIEDEEHIAEGLKFNLSLQGHEVMTAPDGVSGLRKWREWQPHLIVLDIMLPGIDGFSVLQSIRLADERLPVLILTARGAPDDRIRGLASGSDDYMTKPFNLDEFLLRVERLLARGTWSRGEDRDEPSQSIYRFGMNEIDFSTFTARCRQGTIHLTEQEARILKLFIANRGKPLSRRRLLEIGWGYTGGTATRTVDNFMVRFRKYFEDDPQRPVYFRSLRSIGYVFDHD